MVEGVSGIDHAPGHRRRRRTVIRDEAGGMAARFCVQDVVDIALAPNGDVFFLVLGDCDIAHAGKELAQLLRLGMGELDEFEAICAGRIIGGDFRRRRIMRKRTHFLLLGRQDFDYAKYGSKCAQSACILSAH